MLKVILKDNESIYVHSFPSEVISNHINYSKNYYENEFLEAIKDKYPNHINIIDIGANIGNHSQYFLRKLNCKKVYAFEPQDDNFNILKKNLEPFLNKGEAIKMALSDKNTEMPLYNSQKENYGGFSLFKYEYKNMNKSFLVEEKIEVRTLDSYNLTDITMIKIDVENFELNVLKGGIETIKRNKPILFIENLAISGHKQLEGAFVLIEKFLINLDYSIKELKFGKSINTLFIPNN